MSTTKVSPHFYLAEVVHSDLASRLGIDNTIPFELYNTAVATAAKMEKVRTILGDLPLQVTSWYRCYLLNQRLGSNNLTSQHPKAEAVDFICPAYGTPAAICKLLVAMETSLYFDQLILEHTWVHISWNSIPGGLQRGQVLSLLEDGKYANGLTDKNGRSIW